MRSLLFIAIAFLSLQVIADEEIRPGPHNKMGLTKMDPNEKKTPSSTNFLMMNWI